MIEPRPRPWRSLRWRLPVLFSVLVAAILGVFLWVTNRALEQVLLRAGADRAQVAADQVASLLTQSVTRGTGEAQRVASHPAVALALNDPSPSHLEAARAVIAPLSVPGQPAVNLWTKAGVRVLDVASPRATSSSGQPPDLKLDAPTVPGLSLFHRQQQWVVYELVSDVEHGLGYLVVPRTLNTAQTADSIQRLVGNGATVAIGNQRGDVWTDFAKPVAGPSVDASRRGTRAFRNAAGEERLGAVSLIPNTRWVVWMDFPQKLVLAPSRTLMQRMLWLAALFMVGATLLVAIVSARITTPLYHLTRASEAIAAGRYDERVPDLRRDEIGRLGIAFNVMTEHVANAHRDLERRVEERTSALEEAMRELEAFSYSVSHDLRTPLRSIEGFSRILLDDWSAALDAKGRGHLERVRAAAQRMAGLIDDLLALSRVSRADMTRETCDLSALARDAARDLAQTYPSRRVSLTIPDRLVAHGDPRLLRIVLDNLLGNAWKFTSGIEHAEVELASHQIDNEARYVVRDNGVGFDPAFADRLFAPFQRLHTEAEFPGSGIGLATVHRIIKRHGGRIWAEGAPGHGAAVWWTLAPVSVIHV
jgi:signal transduction histidine kinase